MLNEFFAALIVLTKTIPTMVWMIRGKLISYLLVVTIYIYLI